MPDDRGGPQEAADAVGRWLAAEHGCTVELLGPATSAGDGYDTRVHFARFAGAGLPDVWRAPLVLRVHPTADRTALARREAAVQEWCVGRGYPAPPVLAVFGAGELLDLPLQVMVRAPGVPMVAAALRRPWRAPALIRRLADLHAELHDLPPEGFPVPDDLPLAERRLQPLDRWIPELPPADAEALAAARERLRPLLAELATDDPRACHGDFHPLNVLVGDGTTTVIDWSDAALGDPHGDVSRTALVFEVARVAASDPGERAVLGAAGGWMRRTYLESYRRQRLLDPERLVAWEAVHALHGWGQVQSLHAGLFGGAGAAARNVPPALAPWLAARFEAALAAALPDRP